MIVSQTRIDLSGKSELLERPCFFQGLENIFQFFFFFFSRLFNIHVSDVYVE